MLVEAISEVGGVEYRKGKWKVDEQVRYKEAYQLYHDYGRGRWIQIARLVGSRNADQCKSHHQKLQGQVGADLTVNKEFARATTEMIRQLYDKESPLCIEFEAFRKEIEDEDGLVDLMLKLLFQKAMYDRNANADTNCSEGTYLME